MFFHHFDTSYGWLKMPLGSHDLLENHQIPSVFQHFQGGATWYNVMKKSFKTLKTLKNQCFFIILTPLMDGLRSVLEAMTSSKTNKSLQFFNILASPTPSSPAAKNLSKSGQHTKNIEKPIESFTF